MALEMEPLNSGRAAIVLGRMQQQSNVQTPDDDWTGQSNQLERKRRQNRLNQREHRRRKEAELRAKSSNSMEAILKGSNVAPATTREIQRQAAYPRAQDTGPWQLFCAAISESEPQVSKLAQVATVFRADYDKSHEMVRQFQKWVARNYVIGSPKSDHVLVLIKFNIFRAVVENAKVLGIRVESAMEDDTLSPFAPRSSLEKYVKHHPILELPAALRPTALQSRILHHPWIDLLPIPRMRDNLILAGDSYDESDLCEDFCGFYNRSETRSGLIIWGSPWDTAAWEFTPFFMEKWAWVLIGCTDLMLATNYWRQKRGERPLNFAGLEG